MRSGQLPAAHCPVEHTFTPGLYVRTIFMPAGTLVVSEIHRTEHPFIISQGRVKVLQPGTGWEELCAPHLGITQPNTQRVLVVVEDTIWSTMHVTDKTDVEEIRAEIIEPFDGPVPGLAEALEELEPEGQTNI